MSLSVSFRSLILLFTLFLFSTLFTPFSWRFCQCADKDGDSARPRADSRGTVTCPEPLGNEKLDLSKPRTSICKSFEVDVGGVLALVFLIEPKVNVTKIVHESKGIWKSTDDKRCLYCIVFLKQGIPTMISVILRNSEELFQLFYKFKNRWRKSKRKYVDKINALKVATDPPTKFTLDISGLEDTDKFKVLSSYISGIKTHCFYPKPGYAIGRVVCGHGDIWEASNRQRCFFCNVMQKDDVVLLLVAVNNGRRNYSMRFQKVDGKWRYLRVVDFARKMAEINGEPVVDRPPPFPVPEYLFPQNANNA